MYSTKLKMKKQSKYVPIYTMYLSFGCFFWVPKSWTDVSWGGFSSDDESSQSDNDEVLENAVSHFLKPIY